MSRTREIKADELLEMFREVRDRGSKVLPEMEGETKEVITDLVISTTDVLSSEAKKSTVRNLSEEELDLGLEHGERFLRLIETAEEIAEGTLPFPHNHYVH